MRKNNPDTALASWPCEKNPDTAPEPGQDHTKSHEITLQVHFTTSTVLRKILTLPWAKNPDTAAGPILPNKNPDTAQLSWPSEKNPYTALAAG
jgi:hypothetical protein